MSLFLHAYITDRESLSIATGQKVINKKQRHPLPNAGTTGRQALLTPAQVAARSDLESACQQPRRQPVAAALAHSAAAQPSCVQDRR